MVKCSNLDACNLLNAHVTLLALAPCMQPWAGPCVLSESFPADESLSVLHIHDPSSNKSVMLAQLINNALQYSNHPFEPTY